MKRLQDYEFLVLALFSAALEDVSGALVEVIAEHFEPGHFGLFERTLDLGKVYTTRPPAGGAHAKRAALFEPAAARGTAAMVANLEDGWLTMVNVLAQRVAGEHLLIRTDEAKEFPMTDLEVWSGGSSVRYVGALKEDPSWEFNQRGEPREFEDVATYSKRRIRDRLNRDLLVELVRRAGWSIDHSGFWESERPAFYVVERQR